METKELEAALDMFAKPQLLRAQLEKDLSTQAEQEPVTAQFSEEMAAELLRGIAESLDAVKPQYETIRAGLVAKHGKQHRDMAAVLDLTGKAYGVVKDHWGEIFVILSMLNNKGYLNKIKKNAVLKPLFDVLFEKK